jgi:pilus assembly protein CpaC
MKRPHSIRRAVLTTLLTTAAAASPMLLSAGPAYATDDIALGVGAQRLIAVPGPVSKIVIAQPGIVTTSVMNDHQVSLVGVKGGHTALTIFTAENPNEGMGYEVTVGDAPRHAGVQPAGDGGLAKALQSDPDLKGIQTSTSGDGILMTGTVPSLEAHERAAALAKLHGGDRAIDDLTSITGKQMVAVEIKFAAVSVSTLNELGFNFQQLGGSIQGASTAPSTVNAVTSSGRAGLGLTPSLPLQSAFNLFLNSSKSNSFATLSVLSSTGLMQLLAEPTLMVRSGEHAAFLAGGEVPIPVPQGGSATGAITIEYHPYGVKLEVEPVVLSDKRIALKVAPEVSEIDNSNALSFDGFSVPAFRRRSTSTMVELGDGQSFVIAGLIYNNNSFTENKVPWLGDIPVLGDFFKVTQNSRERQELIVIATPHLVSPLDPKALPPLPGAGMAAYNPSFGEILTNADPLGRAVVNYGLMR